MPQQKTRNSLTNGDATAAALPSLCVCGGCNGNCCCQSQTTGIKGSVENPAGLSRLNYRIGRRADFFAAMKARLSDPDLPGVSGANGITARTTDDPAIALLDAWAGVADTLTFYQERIANESFLSTATERQSVGDLVGLLGYRMRPGVASHAYLAYELDPPNPLTATGQPSNAAAPDLIIASGSGAQSVPRPGETQQTFETSAPLTARAEWNNLQVRLTGPQNVPQAIHDKTEPELYFAGTRTQLKPNNPLLVVLEEQKDKLEEQKDKKEKKPLFFLFRILRVDEQPENDRTRVVMKPWREDKYVLNPAPDAPSAQPSASPQSFPFGGPSGMQLRDFTRAQLLKAVRFPPRGGAYSVVGVFALRTRASLFGHNAPLNAVANRDGQTFHFEEWPLVKSVLASAGTFDITVALSLRYTRDELIQKVRSIGRQVGGDVGRAIGRAIGGGVGKDAGEAAAAAGFIQEMIAWLDAFATNPTVPPWPPSPLPIPPAPAPAPPLWPALPTPAGGVTRAQQAKTDGGNAGEAAGVVRAAASGRSAGQRIGEAFGDANGILGATGPNPIFGLLLQDLLQTNRWRITVTAGLGGGKNRMEGILSERDLADFAAPVPLEIRNALGDIVETVLVNLSGVQITGQVAGGIEESLALPRFVLTATYQKGGFPVTVDTNAALGTIAVSSPTPNTKFADVLVESSQFSSASALLKAVVLNNDVSPSGGPVHHTITMTGGFSGNDQAEASHTLSLNLPESQIVPQQPDQPSYVVIDRPAEGDTRRLIFGDVTEVVELSRADYGISGKVTNLRFIRRAPEETKPGETKPDIGWIDPDKDNLGVVRQTVVMAQSEELLLAEMPDTTPVPKGATALTLDGVYENPGPNRILILTGEVDYVADGAGSLDAPDVSDRLTYQEPITAEFQTRDPDVTTGDRGRTVLKLLPPLKKNYKRGTVRIYGNVVEATQGATRTEVLGSGDSFRANQKFTLRQGPLTYLLVDGSVRSTLQVRVSELLWRPVDDFETCGPRDQVYMVRQQYDGGVSVSFGDGIHGARLPTGDNNVRAIFRIGLGTAGNVGAETITTLLTRPLGVRSVINPIAASGGADPDGPETAREAAPRQTFTFGRLVSVVDYEDYARTLSGVERASASYLTDGEKSVLFLVVLGANGDAIDDATRESLRRGLVNVGDPRVSVDIENGKLLYFTMEADLAVLPQYNYADVEQRVRAALWQRFGFASAQFGQSIAASAIRTVIQNVPGVAYVDLNVASEKTPATTLETVLRARGTQSFTQPAQLLCLQSADKSIVLKQREYSANEEIFA